MVAAFRQQQWKDELLKAGIRGKNRQKIEFAEIETLSGTQYLHARGITKDDGEAVVISFGPEHAPLEQRQVEFALREAEKLRPAPLMIVFAAFNFDPEAAKDIDELNWPGVTLLKVQMNTDLLTEDLKKKRASKDGWNKLAKNLKATLNEDRLEAYHGTVSLPFAAGLNRKVAVKLIDDRGIESLKILPLAKFDK